MKSYVTAALLAFAMAPGALVQGQGMMVNSLTDVVTCEPIKITWQGGSPPYYLSLIPAGQPSASAIKQFQPSNTTSYTWTVDIAAGTSFTTELKDSTGQVVYSGEQPVQPGPDQSCVNSAVSESAPSSTAATSVSSTSGTGTPGFIAASTTASNTATGTSASTSGSHSATSTSSGAKATPTQLSTNSAARGYTFGAVGGAILLGLLGFALM